MPTYFFSKNQVLHPPELLKFVGTMQNSGPLSLYNYITNTFLLHKCLHPKFKKIPLQGYLGCALYNHFAYAIFSGGCFKNRDFAYAIFEIFATENRMYPKSRMQIDLHTRFDFVYSICVPDFSFYLDEISFCLSRVKLSGALPLVENLKSQMLNQTMTFYCITIKCLKLTFNIVFNSLNQQHFDILI